VPHFDEAKLHKAAKARCVATTERTCHNWDWTAPASPPQRGEPQATTEPSVLGDLGAFKEQGGRVCTILSKPASIESLHEQLFLVMKSSDNI